MTKQREQAGGTSGAEVWRDTTWTYDNRNRKITEKTILQRSPEVSRFTDLGYDAAGNVILVHHADDTCTSKDYDSMNRVIRSTDEMGKTTTYTYYPSGNPEYTIDPNGNSYYYSYDASNRPTYFYQTNADKSGFDYEQSSYDAAGNVIAFRNRSGAWKTLQYDNRNREIATSWSDGVTPATTTSYNTLGLVSQRTNATSTLTYNYDAAGQLTQERQAITGAPPKTLTYQYDQDGNRTRMRARTQ
jgi:YD repeat-containing protein